MNPNPRRTVNRARALSAAKMAAPAPHPPPEPLARTLPQPPPRKVQPPPSKGAAQTIRFHSQATRAGN